MPRCTSGEAGFYVETLDVAARPRPFRHDQDRACPDGCRGCCQPRRPRLHGVLPGDLLGAEHPPRAGHAVRARYRSGPRGAPRAARPHRGWPVGGRADSGDRPGRLGEPRIHRLHGGSRQAAGVCVLGGGRYDRRDGRPARAGCAAGARRRERDPARGGLRCAVRFRVR